MLVGSTFCRRGYVSSWGLAHGRLYLLKVAGEYEMRSAEPAFAWWYSGNLTVGDGAIVDFGSIRTPPRFEHEQVITIKYGVVRSVEHVPHKPGESGGIAPTSQTLGRDVIGNAAKWAAEEAPPVNRAQTAARLLRLYKRREPRPWNEWPPHPDQLAELLAALNLRAREVEAARQRLTMRS
jgi:hypothetical protein